MYFTEYPIRKFGFFKGLIVKFFGHRLGKSEGIVTYYYKNNFYIFEEK